MAVEARHLNFFSPQILPNRDMMNPIDANAAAVFNAQMGYGAFPPLGDETALFSMQNLVAESSLMAPLAKPAVKSVDSSVTFNGNSNGFMTVSSRKRPREDSVMDHLFFQPSVQGDKSCAPLSFLGHDLSLHLQQQQLDVDRLIFQHMERVKMEVEQKRKAQFRRILAAIEQGLAKRLRSKEEEIDKMTKLNLALEERVKSLCVENHIWRDLAQSNEATANALRSNLEQVLAAQAGTSPEEEDAESCCASSGEASPDEEAAAEGRRRRRVCRRCGTAEASVLVLPCRHLCLCAACGSAALDACPVCHSPKNGSVHVNLCS